ncbi:MAG: UPF0262 family protein [Alphaproteobacteria bacterium]|nr:UPF0262 family protein [Alphaproteobacteria bacterium]
MEFSETDRIANLRLDEKNVIRRSPEVEHERAVALYDLLDMNRFRLTDGTPGPYTVHLSIDTDGKRLVFNVRDQEDVSELAGFQLSIRSFRSLIRDYFQICESYYDAIKKHSPSQIETIDMARRGLHNDGADMLRERLAEHALMDKATVRRLFTLVCVLHIRG